MDCMTLKQEPTGNEQKILSISSVTQVMKIENKSFLMFCL